MAELLPGWVYRARERRGQGAGASGAAPHTATSRTPLDTRTELTARMGVPEANVAGDVHGGWIMKLCDDAAVIAATRHARCRVVTLAVDGMVFHSAIKVGDVVTLKATINAAWRSSMEAGVRVEAEDVQNGSTRHTLTAYFTMVALDADARPTTVPRLVPQTLDEKRRAREATLRRQIRLTGPSELISRTDGRRD